MTTDWKALARQVGSLQEDGSEVGGDAFDEKSLEEILGPEWVMTSVEHILGFKPGSELAIDCLRFICSWQAVEYAYKVYKSSTGERAERAIWIIKHIAHPDSLEWVDEFFNDKNVARWGVDLLDQLVWRNRIKDWGKVELLLTKIETMYNTAFMKQAEFIRSNRTQPNNS